MQLSTAQAALRLGVSPDRIRQLERTKRLPAEWSPLGRLFDSGDVDTLAEERRQHRSDIKQFVGAGTPDAAA
jgi:hypothetical protein